MNIRDSWPAFALMVFAVASGQIGRLGQKYERGIEIGRKQVIVELTMLPSARLVAPRRSKGTGLGGR
ncbi:hypothetical protein [Sphingomonas endolithica]|uniref:hypothetical protein n=1 Tax=Sphingomonas endolithica TaxID=2972485 RepID=UPI0021AFE5ED|nr:hypothetical protein [Sphingomonas sp. ZFBP2030]